MEQKPPVWFDTSLPPAGRLLSFEAWLTERMATLLHWPGRSKRQDREIQQCKAFVRLALRDLHNHGYLFDGPPLAKIIEDKLAEIAKLQRLGKITNLYPYFRHIWSNYVGPRAEELKAESMSLGCHINHLDKKIRAMETIPALEAQRHKETLREQMAKLRKSAKRAAAEKNQTSLLPS